VREYFEELESQQLNSYSVKSKSSLGRSYKETNSITRTCFQRDRDRVIHSKSFRRLKHKTQVFVATHSDHYRSRLTHSIEVAQISRHLCRLLKINEDLAECIALAHDLGHTPFGHYGETTLNDLLKSDGGFEHNIHSLRIVETIEQKYPNFTGLNLSFEVKEGLKKHFTPWDKPRTSSTFISLEAQVTNISDEIAYNNHDIDDGLSSEILNIESLIKNVEIFKEANRETNKKYSALQIHEKKHLINSLIISKQVENVFIQSNKNIQKSHITTIDDLQKINYPLINFDNEMKEKNTQLRDYLFENFYLSPKIKNFNNNGGNLIKKAFKFLKNNPKFLTDSFLRLFSLNLYSTNQIIGFYIAGMTDPYTIKFCKHNNLATKEEINAFNQ
jgi:dGTPase